MQKLRGTGVALVTPFSTDLTIDVDGLRCLVVSAIEGGVDYLVVLGTTAENVTLTREEKEVVKATVIAANEGRLPLVLGVGGNNTAAIVQELEQPELTKGFDAILSVTPYYNRPTQEGLYQHYKSIASASALPILLYNVPARTGVNLLPETAIRVARDCKNVIGIKEAAGSMEQVLRLLKDRPQGFLVISGDDMLALPLVTAGGDGVISVIGQGLPKLFSGMIRDGLHSAFAKAYQTQYQLMPLIDAIFAEGNPAGIKALLKNKGICNDEVRLPLVKASEKLSSSIATFLKAL